jgi:cytochrome bd-type quinol oxidase subunit 1
MRRVYDVEEVALTATLSDRIALVETAYMAEVSSFFILWFNSWKNDPSGLVTYNVFCHFVLHDCSLAKNEAKRCRGFVR